MLPVYFHVDDQLKVLLGVIGFAAVVLVPNVIMVQKSRSHALFRVQKTAFPVTLT